MKINKFIVAILCILFYSCSLEEEVSDRLTPQGFITGTEEAIASINGTYHALTRTGLYRRDWFALADAGADDVSSNFYSEIDNYTYAPTNGDIEDIWQFNYFGINRANNVLDNIDKAEMPEALRDRIKGEALFLRALFYNGLVTLYGKAHVKTTATTTAEISFRLDPAEVVYRQIEQDLLDAEALLPAVHNAAVENWRATKGSAQALLARVYLFQEKWQEASAKAQEVINSDVYQLFPTIADLVNPDNENGMEHIFSVQGNSFTWDTYSDLGNFYLPNDNPEFRGIGRFRPELDFYWSFDDEDQRKEEFFLTEYINNSGDTIMLGEQEPPYGFKYRKRFDSNFPLLRLAEMYLIVAEAENEANAAPTSAAIEALNTIRRRAYGIFDGSVDVITGIGKEEFRTLVRTERRKELCFEGVRRLDLARWATLVEAIEAQDAALNRSKRPVQPHMQLYPIPQREIDLNTSISQDDQNPGY